MSLPKTGKCGVNEVAQVSKQWQVGLNHRPLDWQSGILPHDHCSPHCLSEVLLTSPGSNRAAVPFCGLLGVARTIVQPERMGTGCPLVWRSPTRGYRTTTCSVEQQLCYHNVVNLYIICCIFILRKPSSEAQHTKALSVIISRDRQKASLNRGTTKYLGLQCHVKQMWLDLLSDVITLASFFIYGKTILKTDRYNIEITSYSQLRYNHLWNRRRQNKNISWITNCVFSKYSIQPTSKMRMSRKVENW